MIDLTVDEVSHYCTVSGLVNQNCGFDEATQFSQTQYQYLHSRVRRKEGSEVPGRVRCASNPGGIGHEWVRQRFLIEGATEGRPFIPARLEDNPHLDQVEYERALAQLDPVTRAQLRHGDWEVLAEGRMFRREWMHYVEPGEVPPLARQVRYWDLAATEPKPGADPDWTAGARMGVSREGTYYLLDVRRVRQSPQGVEAFIRATAAEDGREVNIHMEQEPGSSGVAVIDHYRRTVLPGFAFYGQRATGDKQTRAAPLSAQLEGGNVVIVRGAWVSAFLDEVCSFPSGAHDDQVDAVSGAFEQLAHTVSGRVETGKRRPLAAGMRW